MNRQGVIVRNFFIAAVLLTISCDEQPDQIVYTGPDFVFLDSKPQVSVYENQSTPILIPVKVNLAQTENLDVTFEVIGDNILKGSDYVVNTASPVEIPRNKYSANISISVINNAIIQPEKRLITVRITGIDSETLTVQVVQEVQIDLLDDDCDPSVPKVAIWTGEVNIEGYSGEIDPGVGEGGAGGICGGSLVVTGYFFGTSNPTSRVTINMTQNVSFPTKGIASVIRTPAFEGSTLYEYEASGTYDETVENITLNFTLYESGDPIITGTHIITPR